LPKVPFEKPALLLDQQIALLRERGLEIADDAVARQFLESISYYRLSGYTRYFTQQEDDRRERFRAGTSLTDVVDLYVFDRKLRAVLSEAFERIEIGLKGSLAYQGSIGAGPFWITDPANFDAGRHGEIMTLVDAAVIAPDGKHKTQFLDAFYKKYSDNYPPAWMITEVLSFHGASMLFKYARGSIRKPIADQFGVQQDTLQSWLHALVFARNVCAHHQRFWNRKFTIKPRIPRAYHPIWPEAAQDRLYITCCIAKSMITGVGGDTTWPNRLRTLINERPNVPLAQMGFPDCVPACNRDPVSGVIGA
jgi:abortive infection bacteriophage resistance protein